MFKKIKRKFNLDKQGYICRQIKKSVALDTSKKVLFAASNESTSYKVRGRQISCLSPHWSSTSGSIPDGYDIYVIVKKVTEQQYEKIKETGKTIVLDILDFWGGRVAGNTSKEAFFVAASSYINSYSPDAVIFPSMKMLSDHINFFPRESFPRTYIGHHYNPLYALTPKIIRKKISSIAYIGDNTYISNVQADFKKQLKSIGIDFYVNPHLVHEMDAFVSIRAGDTANFMNLDYKPDVKVVNSLALGKPIFVHQDIFLSNEVEQIRSVIKFNDIQQLCSLINSIDYWQYNKLCADAAIASEKYSIRCIGNQYALFFQSI